MHKIICLFMISLACFSYAEAEKITFVAEPYCPYACEEGTDYEGMMVDVTRTIFESEGYLVEYTTRPWARALRESRQGKHTGLIATVPAESSDFYYPQQEGASLTHCFYIRSDAPWRFVNIESLQSVRLGVILGYGYDSISDEFGRYVKQNKENKALIQWIGGETANLQNFKKLAVNRIDTTFVDKAVAAYWLKKGGLSDRIKEAGCLKETAPLYVAFSPANPASPKYAAIFDSGLRKLRASGKLDEIVAKYGMKDWK